jgi:hypothetical protein
MCFPPPTLPSLPSPQPHTPSPPPRGNVRVMEAPDRPDLSFCAQFRRWCVGCLRIYTPSNGGGERPTGPGVGKAFGDETGVDAGVDSRDEQYKPGHACEMKVMAVPEENQLPPSPIERVKSPLQPPSPCKGSSATFVSEATHATTTSEPEHEATLGQKAPKAPVSSTSRNPPPFLFPPPNRQKEILCQTFGFPDGMPDVEKY